VLCVGTNLDSSCKSKQTKPGAAQAAAFLCFSTLNPAGACVRLCLWLFYQAAPDESGSNRWKPRPCADTNHTQDVISDCPCFACVAHHLMADCWPQGRHPAANSHTPMTLPVAGRTYSCLFVALGLLDMSHATCSRFVDLWTGFVGCIVNVQCATGAAVSFHVITVALPFGTKGCARLTIKHA